MRLLLPAFLLATAALAQAPPEPDLIPRPAHLQMDQGTLDLRCPWTVQVSSERYKALADLFEQEIAPLHPASDLNCLMPMTIALQVVTPDTLMPPEWYALGVMRDGIVISATTEEGLFRGTRTLIQLLEQGKGSASLPCLSITDQPRFPWRGMHLDVCRHFFPVAFVKKYIDLLARYKMNSFHWHLTEDQGWRIEIKSHPKLTEVGAWRKGSQVGPYSRREYDSIPYGGFYTQDEIREVVAYAAARHINVVPEIEMPGHAMAALAAYPQLGCTGGPYEVQRGWGVFEDVFCAGSDSTFALLEDVLTEVMDLFPSPYIHIGGDECPKEQWKTCAKCQARKKAEGLKDEHELQSYFIQRIEKFVNAKGRKIIGWDEILEGGLAPNATVMSWQGTEGGIAAARSGHYAVMSPGSHCYFDHYQGDPANEPLAIGGYTTVQKVYSYEPIPAELRPEEHKYILGAQGNVWTEYILTSDHVEYMAVPRMLALAEVLWTPKEKRDEADFIRRLEAEFPRLEELKVNASKSMYQVQITPKVGETPGQISIHLTTNGERQIRFNIVEGQYDMTIDGLGTYEAPYLINRSCKVHAFTAHGSDTGPMSIKSFRFNKATAQRITISVPPNERYDEGGAFTLVDGITAQEKRVNTEWLGWREGVTINVDMGIEQDISYIGLGALNETHSWIHLPKEVEVAISNDGKSFESLLIIERWNRQGGRIEFGESMKKRARFVRFKVKHPGAIPEGYPGAGSPAWMFLDEIEVR
jgi:hexosaminidase